MVDLRTETMNRNCRAVIAVLVVVSSLLVAGQAEASCGDYLIPLGQSGTHGHSDEMMLGSMDSPTAAVQTEMAESTRLPGDALPCTGPGCGQAPDDQVPLRIATEPTRDSQPLSSAVRMPNFEHLPKFRFDRGDEPIAVERLESGGPFRPPRM